LREAPADGDEAVEANTDEAPAEEAPAEEKAPAETKSETEENKNQ
jgi:hypothetical protein